MPTKKSILLPGGCWCSPLSVYPKNYKSCMKSMQVNWYVSYRFYDPRELDKNGQAKSFQRILKGMNECREWKARKEAVALIINHELSLLKDQGFNPRTGCYQAPAIELEISPDTSFLKALTFAKEKIKKGNSIKNNLKSIIEYTEKAAIRLSFNKLSIGEIKRKHIKLLMDQLETIKEKWTANTFNHYRSHLSMLFNELMEYEAVEYNPVILVKKQKHIRKQRQVLSDGEREQVYDHLQTIYPSFRRAMEIFFHSGIRETEMLRIKKRHVDLVKERLMVTVLKGGQPAEEWREIKSVAVNLWRELMEKAKEDDFIFSFRFSPGNKKLKDDYITKSWYRYVKNKKMNGIGITADFYALKHLHTTEVVDLLDEQSAAKHNGHKSLAMVQNVYDVDNAGRKGKLVKMLQNGFIKQIPIHPE